MIMAYDYKVQQSDKICLFNMKDHVDYKKYSMVKDAAKKSKEFGMMSPYDMILDRLSDDLTNNLELLKGFDMDTLNEVINLKDQIPESFEIAGMKINTFDNPVIDGAKSFADQSLKNFDLDTDKLIGMAKDLDMNNMLGKAKQAADAFGLDNHIKNAADAIKNTPFEINHDNALKGLGELKAIG